MKARRLPLVRPTAAFAGLLLVLFAMWYGASSQNNAGAYLLLFALGSVAAVSIPHTVLNVTGLKATARAVKPSFAGDEVSLPIELVNQSRRARYGIRVHVPGSGGNDERIDEIRAGKAARVVLRFPASKRGEHQIRGLCLTTTYPIGFLRAVGFIGSTQRYLVYPKPAGNPKLPDHPLQAKQNRTQAEFGEGDDFAGLRAYVPGESQRHIDWKAVARGQPLMTKQYTAERNAMLYLDFDSLPLIDAESRLAQLALWILEAERARRPYGLRLPRFELPPGLGEAHCHRCLRALALFK